MSSISPAIVHPSQIEVLSQEISETEGDYRIRAKDRVHYLTIDGGVYDNDTMCRPYLLIPALPAIPDTDWTQMHITRDPDDNIQSNVAHTPLPSISKPWHPMQHDILSLPPVRTHRSRVKEVVFDGRPAITKIACWPWEVPRISNESEAYRDITEHSKADEPPLAPEVLGHLTENGRVIGLLLEKVEGNFATINDLPRCSVALERLHSIGLIHGDVNRYNFLIDRASGSVRMVDFEHVEPWEADVANLELEVLPAELEEETGRGGPATVFGEREVDV